MGYAIAAWLHAGVVTGLARLRSEERAQGTVEYVALILLVAVVLAGVVVATRKAKLGTGEIGTVIMQKIKEAIRGVK